MLMFYNKKGMDLEFLSFFHKVNKDLLEWKARALRESTCRVGANRIKRLGGPQQGYEAHNKQKGKKEVLCVNQSSRAEVDSLLWA